jgi:hypothetical protein
MFNLSRYFSTLSLILIGLAAGLLGTMYREVSVRQMTMLAEDRNVRWRGSSRIPLARRWPA